MDDKETRWLITNTWNGGAGGTKTEFTSKQVGNDGLGECMKWIHDHTSFSYYEATHNQGYSVNPVKG